MTTSKPTTATKAIFGGLSAFLGSLAVALADNGITPVEGVTVAATTVTALGVVYGVTNTPKGA